MQSSHLAAPAALFPTWRVPTCGQDRAGREHHARVFAPRSSSSAALPGRGTPSSPGTQPGSAAVTSALERGTKGTAAPQTPDPGCSRDANLCPAPCMSIAVAATPPCPRVCGKSAHCVCAAENTHLQLLSRGTVLGKVSSSFPLPLWQISQISWTRTCKKQGRTGIRLKTQKPSGPSADW